MRRLARLGLAPEQLTAVLVTHEHDDHLGGVARLARKFALPVWATPGTMRGLDGLLDGLEVHRIEGYACLCIGAIEVQPFPVPHDAREPAQYVFSDGARRLGVLTDAGCATPHIRRVLDGCDALVLEANHDLDLLARSDYPQTLKQRIAGRFGHLDNAQAAELVAAAGLHAAAAHGCSASEPEQQPARPGARQRSPPCWGARRTGSRVAEQDSGLDWRQIA